MSKGRTVVHEPMPALDTEFSSKLLGQAIRSKRTEKGQRIEDVASRIGFSTKTIAKVEKGDASVSFNVVLKLMDNFGLSLKILDTQAMLSSKESIPKDFNNGDDGWYE